MAERLGFIKMKKGIFMATQSTNDKYASPYKIEEIVASVTRQCDLSYLLRKHVAQDYWVEELRRCFAVTHIENFTDFDYSRCFNYAINEDDVDLRLGDDGFKDYVLRRGVFNRIHILVSALAPYVVHKCVSYYFENGELRIKSLPCHSIKVGAQDVDVPILEFCKRNGLFEISDDDLRKTVDYISLELHGPNPSVFNLLFEDDTSDIPY